MLDALLLACAPLVARDTAAALISVESGARPYAIGVVAGRLERQPRSLQEAIRTASELESAGADYSVGLAQINKRNFHQHGLSLETAFEPCANLRAMQSVLGNCFGRANARAGGQLALRLTLSCYYSGNFKTGFEHGYVRKVVAAWYRNADHY